MEEWTAKGERVVPARLDRLAWKRVFEMERDWCMSRLRAAAERDDPRIQLAVRVWRRDEAEPAP